MSVYGFQRAFIQTALKIALIHGHQYFEHTDRIPHGLLFQKSILGGSYVFVNSVVDFIEQSYEGFLYLLGCG